MSRFKLKACDTLPALAVSITCCADVAAETDAVKVAAVAPGATVTELGTDTSELVLDRFTPKALLAAAAFSVTVQVSVPAPVIDALAQVNELKTGTTVPLRLTVVVDPVTELLVNIS